MDRTKDKPDLSILFISAIRAQLILLLTAIVLLIVFCAVAYSLDDPDTVIIPLSLAALFGSGLAGGIAAVRISGDGLFSGWLSGVVSALLIWLMSFLPFPAAAHSFAPLPATILFLCLPVSSLIGAVIGRKRKKSPGGPPKRMRKHSS